MICDICGDSLCYECCFPYEFSNRICGPCLLHELFPSSSDTSVTSDTSDTSDTSNTTNTLDCLNDGVHHIFSMKISAPCSWFKKYRYFIIHKHNGIIDLEVGIENYETYRNTRSNT